MTREKDGYVGKIVGILVANAERANEVGLRSGARQRSSIAQFAFFMGERRPTVQLRSHETIGRARVPIIRLAQDLIILDSASVVPHSVSLRIPGVDPHRGVGLIRKYSRNSLEVAPYLFWLALCQRLQIPRQG